MKSQRMLRLLTSSPFNYTIKSQRGSHLVLISPSYPEFTFIYHHGKELSGIRVRKILCNEIGLSLNQALGVMK
jgi:hypothetical protein